MTVTVITLLTVCDDCPSELAAFFQATKPLMDRAGARFVKRFAINEVVVGRRPARTVMIMEYPSRAAVDAVFGSAEYQRVIPIRNQAFLDYQVSIVGD